MDSFGMAATVQLKMCYVMIVIGVSLGKNSKLSPSFEFRGHCHYVGSTNIDNTTPQLQSTIFKSPQPSLGPNDFNIKAFTIK